MEKEPHPDLSHGTLNYQNNNFNHSNSLTTLNTSYPNSGDRSHLQQQYSANPPQTSQHSLSVQGSDSARCTGGNSGTVIVPGCSSLSPRVAPGQGSVYMTAQSSQGLNTYPETSKPPSQSFYGVGTSVTSSGQGSTSGAYVPHANLQNTPGSASRFGSSSYSTPMTNSTVQNPQNSGSSASTTDLEKRQLIQQQLLLLLHAQCCRQEQIHSTPCANPHCRTMRNVLQHMKNCTEGKNCRKPHCASSRQIISHWKNCSSRECPVCGPLKRSQQKQAQQRPPGQVPPSVPQPGEANGISPGQSVPVLRSPAPQNVRRPLPVPAATSTPQVRMGAAYAQSIPNSSIASTPSQSGNECTEQADWRASVNMEHRDHVVRRM